MWTHDKGINFRVVGGGHFFHNVYDIFIQLDCHLCCGGIHVLSLKSQKACLFGRQILCAHCLMDVERAIAAHHVNNTC